MFKDSITVQLAALSIPRVQIDPVRQCVYVGTPKCHLFRARESACCSRVISTHLRGAVERVCRPGRR